MRHPDAGRAEPLDLGLVGVDAVRHPGPGGEPAHLLELLHRPPPKALQAERVLVRVFGQVGVQPDVQLLGQLRGPLHQAGGHREGRARRQRHLDHGPGGRVVVQFHQALAVREDLIVVLHDRVRRQPAVLLRQGHRPAGAVEAHADLAGGGDLRGPQVAATAGGHVQVVHGGGASAQGELGEADPGRQVGGFLVQPGPQRVQRGEPGEQRPVDRGPVGPGEVLVDVVVGVDQAGRHQAPGGVDHLGRLRRGIGRRPHAGDHSAGDRHPPAGQLAPVTVARRHQLRVAHQQISRHPASLSLFVRHSRPVARSGRGRPSRRSRSGCRAAPTRR